MANGIRTGDSRGFNKGRSLKFREGSRVRQTPEEGRRAYRPKRCGNNDEDNDKNKHILLIMFLTNLSLFFSAQLNSSKYCNVSLTIQLNISHLFTHC